MMLLLASIIMLPLPTLPAIGIDESWIVAAEHARKAGLVYGRDFVFTYGPLAFIATNLFDGGTFIYVIAANVALTVMWFLPVALCRRPSALALYAIGLATMWLVFDARVVGALAGVLFLGLRRPGWWLGAVAAVFGLLAFVKVSLLLVALPIFVLLDLHALAMHRRLPVCVASLLLSIAVCWLLLGFPLADLPAAVAPIWQIVDGYSGAMQVPTGFGGYVSMLVFWVIAAALCFGLYRSRRRSGLPLLTVGAAMAGLAWCCFMAFKMGFVRQDARHMALAYEALLFLSAPTLAFILSVAALTTIETVSALLVGLACWTAGSFYTYRALAPELPRSIFVSNYAAGSFRRFVQGLAWLSPSHWRSIDQARRTRDARLCLRYPPSVTGSVDAMPIDVTEVVFSRLTYTPRPIPQGYSSYTAPLQRMDAAFLNDPNRSPRTILYKLDRFGDRLPSLNAGPSQLALMRWYDIVDSFRGALVLRKRERPRLVRLALTGTIHSEIGDWVALPRQAELTLAAVAVEQRLLGHASKFLVRQPQLFIEVRLDDGSVRVFRFVPDMARQGFVLSPLPVSAGPSDLSDAVQSLQPQGASVGLSRVTAFRLVGSRWARASFSTITVRFAAAQVNGLQRISPAQMDRLLIAKPVRACGGEPPYLESGPASYLAD